MVGGVAGLAGAWVAGPRIGRFGPGTAPNPQISVHTSWWGSVTASSSCWLLEVMKAAVSLTAAETSLLDLHMGMRYLDAACQQNRIRATEQAQWKLKRAFDLCRWQAKRDPGSQ